MWGKGAVLHRTVTNNSKERSKTFTNLKQECWQSRLLRI